MADKVRVAVRVRPFNRREKEIGTKCVIDMNDNQTVLYHPSIGAPKDSSGYSAQNKWNKMQRRMEVDFSDQPAHKKAPKSFAFDSCFLSMEENDPRFASQETVFSVLGDDILESSFSGYNACIFAYGQTGSGKSFTMMGSQDQKGLIPRLCEGLFERIRHHTTADTSFKVEVSYMEIYNERVRDLLDPEGRHNLRVREHNILGPYVEGLSALAVQSFEDIDSLMSEGNKSRTVAATNMNNESSRSHAVFNIILTATLTDLTSGVTGEKVSKMSLVDLAGSERAQKTGAVGERLKEGSNINKSLTTLGLVISALADSTSGKSKGKFVPYRDSVLTWLLKDNLGGNSKTVMVATLSPAGDNYEETLSTLRYADRAKRIVNHAVVNEDPNARIIRELREEVDMLRGMLQQAQSLQAPDLVERLEESEKLMKEMGKTWEEKLHETELRHQERHAALEKMGISVQTSGIGVKHSLHYLVNLNADPSLNELLVYYLKERTFVGRPDAPVEQDIQLSGLGIQPQHCVIELDCGDVCLEPQENARTCVNGQTITTRTRVKHGDRILWGNNHFFRLNCPKSSTSPQSETPEMKIDYDFAQEELMMAQLGNDPINEAINKMEKQHEEDKQEALDRQREMYERQMQMLRNQLMSPSTPSNPYPPFVDTLSKMTPTTTNNMQTKYHQWVSEREKLFKQSLSRLKEEVLKANSLVREANFLAQEMRKNTEFSVTLQIPASNLSPNRKRGAFVSEPAILVKRKNKNSSVWTMEKFENKMFDMRELYEERKEHGPMKDQGPPQPGDPFYESQENHNLIGVANIFLEALYYDVTLDYHAPIISQQGEVAGRLHIEISKVAGSMPERIREADAASETSTDSGRASELDDEGGGVAMGQTLVCIKEARGLPPALSHFVFCQYLFWGHPEPIVVPPMVETEGSKRHGEGITFKFDHKKEFTVNVTEEFLEHCADGALSMEVWGHRSTGLPNGTAWEVDQFQAKSRSIMDRWSELTRKIELWTEIHELNESGEYSPVEVTGKSEVYTGGVFQLRQGHSRRIMAQVRPVQNSGTLPIICESISMVSIGCVCGRSKLQKGLDSYQEEDLNVLREKWTEALAKRREYLDEQLQKIMSKEEKSDADQEREQSLVDQWVGLTEERNAVLVPAPSSGIPGAPADWSPPPGMETHMPVVFLDLNADDMSTPNVKEGLQAAGVNSILPKEHGAQFFTLPLVKNSPEDLLAIVSWDSSIHDSFHLNRVTPANERVYLILKPLGSFVTGTASLQDNVVGVGVTYEVVSNIPKASEDLEERESLAQMAASQNEQNTADGETYIEKYIRGVSAVESITTLDRLRQEVTIKELLAAKGRPLRKATSVPNIHNILASPRPLDDQVRSDSIQDLSFSDTERFGGMPKSITIDAAMRHRVSDPKNAFALARPTFLNLRTNTFNLITKPSPKPSSSPIPSKLATLIEEQQSTKSTLQDTEEEEALEDEEKKLNGASSDFSDDQATPVETMKDIPVLKTSSDPEDSDVTSGSKLANGSLKANGLSHSNTADSLTDAQAGSCFTPSMSSSGYGSQTVSAESIHNVNEAGVGGENEPKVVPEVVVEGEGPDGSDTMVSSSSSDTQSTPVAQSSLDMYSTHAMAELEQLSGGNDTFTSTGGASPDPSRHQTAPQKTSTPELQRHMRGSQSNDELRRGSTSSITSANDDVIAAAVVAPGGDAANSPSRMRKSASMDIRGGMAAQQAARRRGSRSGGAGPLRATYRPSLGEEEQEHSGHDDDSDDYDDTASSFGSRADLHRLGEVPIPSWISVGVPVIVLFSRGGSKNGVVSFIGSTEFASGNWVGVELDTADGKNDGSVKGVRYFRCRPRHGLFVRHDKLIMDKKRMRPGQNKMAGVPANVRRSTGNVAASSSSSASASSPRDLHGSLSSSHRDLTSPPDIMTSSTPANVPSYMKPTRSSRSK